MNKTMLAVMVFGLLNSQGLALAAENAVKAPASSTGTSAAERTVEVKLTEYKIEMPIQLSAGRTLFHVTNAGDMFHRFEIEGKGIEQEIESGLDAGQTRTLALDLKPGVYEVYCPVHGHKKAGMSLKLQVS